MKTQNFKYSGSEFFYNNSFEDYPFPSVFEIIQEYINNNTCAWASDERFKPCSCSTTIHGNVLKKIGFELLRSKEFSQLSIDSFLGLSEPFDCARIIQILENPVFNYVLHHDLKIASIRLLAYRSNFQKAPILNNVYVTAAFETNEYLDL